MSSANHSNDPATSLLIQAAVKSGEARTILQATQQALANAAKDIGNTEQLVDQAKAAALRAGQLRGFRVGYASGLVCGVALGGCAAMLLRAVFA